MDVKARIEFFFDKIRTLRGDPHYIALGMAVGVFTGITPTVPFQTVIAVTLAYLLKASKSAAVIGTLTANPLTLPIYYVGSYNIATSLLGCSIPGDIQFSSVSELLALGRDVTLAMITGGVLLGLVPAMATYLITRRFFQTIRARLDIGQFEPATESANAAPGGSTAAITRERDCERPEAGVGMEGNGPCKSPDKRMES
jgi:uncharacterized protein (DUF2062 family)